MTAPRMDRPIRTLDDLPATGLVFWADFLSTSDDVRMLPFSQQTWRRRAAKGELPSAVKWLGRIASHAEHVRAVALGQDWRTVPISGDRARRSAAAN